MDNVNQPSHYSGNASELLKAVRDIFVKDCDVVDMECIQAMVNQMNDVREIVGFLRGNTFKYQWRYQKKNGIEDLKKAKVYLNWLIEVAQVVEADRE